MNKDVTINGTDGAQGNGQREENVIYQEKLNKYTICCLKAVKHQNNPPSLGSFSSHAG